MVEVSVVLPSKDEEETIGICIRKIRKVFTENGIDGEIIVADNSRDQTPIIAKNLGAKLITPDREGYGYAYRCALTKAGGKYIVMGDADDTYDFTEMQTLLEPLMKGESDMVIGSRFKGKIEKNAMPWHHRRIGNPALTWFLNVFYKTGISDAHCGLRAITKKALENLDLNSDGMEFASEMIVEAAEKGLRIKEIPISYYRRRSRNSKLSSFSDGWRHLRFMLTHAPDHLFTYPGFALLFAGIFLAGCSLLNLDRGLMPRTISLIAGSLLAIAGYQTIFFGFFSKIHGGRSLPQFLTLEKGAAIGGLALIAGITCVSKLVLDWVYRGTIPPVEQSMIGFTAIVLGIQTFFSSFMLSIMAHGRNRA